MATNGGSGGYYVSGTFSGDNNIAGAGFAPMIGGVSSTTISPYFDQCAGGHAVVDSLIEYPDGIMVGTCSVCGVRVTFKEQPGGSPVKRLHALVEMLLDDPETTEAVLKFAKLTEALRDEEKALREAISLLETTWMMVEQYESERDDGVSSRA